MVFIRLILGVVGLARVRRSNSLLLLSLGILSNPTTSF